MNELIFKKEIGDILTDFKSFNMKNNSIEDNSIKTNFFYY